MAAQQREKSYFEQQRELLLGDIGQSLESVLQNINKLNRSLEGVIAVGNEFGSVEALWSQFEGVMARDAAASGAAGGAKQAHEGEGEGEGEGDTTVGEGAGGSGGEGEA